MYSVGHVLTNNRKSRNNSNENSSERRKKVLTAKQLFTFRLNRAQEVMIRFKSNVDPKDITRKDSIFSCKYS